jgi:hypothetical protein
MGTFQSASALPEVGGGGVQVIGEFLIQAALFGVGLDRASKRHAALIFLLAAGFGGAVLV